MRISFTRAGIQISAAVIAIAVFFSYRGVYVEKYSDKKVHAGEIRYPWDIFAVHLGRPRYITVGGKTYKGVRGLPPYYIQASGTNVILFVTECNGRVSFHLHNFDSNRHIAIEAATSGFGWNIGSGVSPGEPYSDYIESLTGDTLTVVTRSKAWKEVETADLKRSSVEHIESYSFDKTGSITNRIVWNSTESQTR